MNSKYLILFTLLVCSSCLIEASDNHQHETESNKTKTKLMDLNFDVLDHIVDELDMIDLLNVAGLNSKTRFIALRIFHLKYWVNSTDNYPKTVVDVLQQLENGTTKISIHNGHLRSNVSTFLNKVINIFGYKTITHLDLGSIQENSLEQFTFPFEAVVELKLELSQEKFTGKIMSFDKLFPKLNKLRVIVAEDANHSFIDCHLPNLEELYIYSDFYTEKECKSFISKNPRIKIITLFGFPGNYMKIMNNLLPNLEKLTVHFDIADEPVRFENVKHAGYIFFL